MWYPRMDRWRAGNLEYALRQSANPQGLEGEGDKGAPSESRGRRMGGAILSQSTEAWPTGEEAAVPDEPSEQSCSGGTATPHSPLTQLASTRLLSWCPSVFGINTLKR